MNPPTPDAQAVFSFLGVVGFLVMLGNQVMQLFRTSTKQKREVSFAEEYASKKELADLKAAVEKNEEYAKERREKIYSMIRDGQRETEGKIDAFRQETKEDMSGVHERVTALVKEISTLNGEIKQALKDR